MQNLRQTLRYTVTAFGWRTERRCVIYQRVRGDVQGSLKPFGASLPVEGCDAGWREDLNDLSSFVVS